jgi:PAS domain S-box-containing protein
MSIDLDLEDLFRDYYELPEPTPVTSSAPSGAPLQPFAAQPVTHLGPPQASPAPQVAPSQAPTPGAPSASDPEPTTSGAKRKSLEEDEDGKEQLTDAQKVERRERNREHAKRSRLRKKFLLESLQEQIYGLQGEIEQLKGIIKKELPEKAEGLIGEVEGSDKNNGKYTPLPLPSGFGPVKTLIEPDYRLMTSLSSSQQNFAISDPSLPDNPIVYCSQGFLNLTGYTLDQVLGRNCRFLQGPGTDQNAVDVIRKGIREGVDTSVCLLNYKADGTPFWNQFFVASLRDAENNIVNHVGVQCEVSKAVVESQESGKK